MPDPEWGLYALRHMRPVRADVGEQHHLDVTGDEVIEHRVPRTDYRSVGSVMDTKEVRGSCSTAP